MLERAPTAGYEHVAPHARTPGAERDIAVPRGEPGDFILTHGSAWTSRLIRWGQALRFRGESAKYTYWNHAALLVDTDGAIVEALGSGVAQRSILDYEPTQHTLVRIIASPEDRAQAAAFARACVGSEYGWLTVVSLGVSLLTGGKLAFGFDGQLICSGLVARALERTSAIFHHEPSRIMPAELAQLFHVDPPGAGTPRGEPPGPARAN